MIRRYKTNNQRRKIRTRSKLAKITTMPWLSVFRSNKHIYVQIIDQSSGFVIASASDYDLKKTEDLTKTQIAELVGEFIAKKAIEKKIKQVVFDRGGYKYHGRVKAVCDGARKAKLII